MSTSIEATTIATNRYAPSGAQDIALYSYNGCEGLTLGQLVNAVCCRIGVCLESQSVNKTNVMTRHARRLQGMSEALSGIINGGDYDSTLTMDDYKGMTYRDFLTNVCGLTISTSSNATNDADGVLPSVVTTPAGKIKFYEAIKSTIQSSTVTNQQDMVDLQTYVTRRDVAYSTATNVVKALGNANLDVAGNF